MSELSVLQETLGNSFWPPSRQTFKASRAKWRVKKARTRDSEGSQRKKLGQERKERREGGTEGGWREMEGGRDGGRLEGLVKSILKRKETLNVGEPGMSGG